jgi:hypothetical protein
MISIKLTFECADIWPINVVHCWHEAGNREVPAVEISIEVDMLLLLEKTIILATAMVVVMGGR